MTEAGQALQGSYPFVGEVTGQDVHLRAGFNTDYRSLRKLEPGEMVVVRSEQGGWYEVTVPLSFDCFIKGQFVRTTEDGMGTVISDNVNLRPTASEYYFPVDQVDRGTELVVIAEHGDWLEVMAPRNATAWVNASLIRKVGSVADHQTALDRLQQQTATRSQSLLQQRRDRVVADKRNRELSAELDQARSRLQALRSAGDIAPETPGEETLSELRAIREILTRVGTEATDSALIAGAQGEDAFVGSILDFHDSVARSHEVIKDYESDLARTEKEYESRRQNILTAPATPATPAQSDVKTGWVEKGFDISTASNYHRLVEGGRILAVISSRRYRLEDFVNMRIAVRGDFKRMGAELDPGGKGTLWVDDLEVIAGRRAGLPR
jgi:uncharacterized protein YgiM (DUF1202 family)